MPTLTLEAFTAAPSSESEAESKHAPVIRTKVSRELLLPRVQESPPRHETSNKHRITNADGLGYPIG